MSNNANKYSEAIINEALYGTGNIVVNAVAGAGKTYTLVEVMSRLDKHTDILFCAFNKKIASEIRSRVKARFNINPESTRLPSHIQVSTCHALGLSIINENFTRGNKVSLDEYKYLTRLSEIISSDIFHIYGHNGFLSYRSNISRLIDYARFNLDSTIEEIQMTALYYGLNLIDNEAEIVYELMEWGKQNMDTIDYTDMIWIPNVLNLETKNKIDFALIDEAQDLSIAQQNIVFKFFKPTTRFIAVGDKNQCINAWCGGDKDSFAKFLAMENTKEYPMPVTRRCPVKVVELAKTIVPQIEAMEDAIDGEINYKVSPMAPNTEDDMVVCRNNAPLAKYYQNCIQNNKQVSFYYDENEENSTKDIWIKLIRSTKKTSLSSDFNFDGVFPELYRRLLDKIKKLMDTHHIDERDAYKNAEIINDYDNIETLEIFAIGLKTSDELIEKINAIHGDRSNKGIKLSTVHRAKGLTVKNQYILCPSLIPSKLAIQDWEIEAENNLLYVAYTRPTHTLNFISEDAFPADNIYSNPEKTMKKLRDIENMLNKITTDIVVNNDRDISGTTKIRVSAKRNVGGMKYKMFRK